MTLFMHTFIVPERQRAFLVRNGEFVAYLGPGKHRRFGLAEYSVEMIDPEQGATMLSVTPDVAGLVPAHEGTVLEVPADHVALVSRDGRPLRVLEPERYLLWSVNAVIDVELVSLSELDSEIPVAFADLASAGVLVRVWIHAHERGLLYVDGVLERELAPGLHALSPWLRHLRVDRVDVRERELQVVGQEIMTADKVTLRLNALAKYRVTAPAVAAAAVKDVHDALYAEVQLAMRSAIAGVSVAQLLEGRVGLATGMLTAVQTRASAWGLEIARLDIKDVVLPGEMKALLNQVIEAEQRAAAQVIMRREEVAATRSLANTARMLESNPVLLRLKELEVLKDVVQAVPNLTVVLGGDELGKQLRLGLNAEGA